MATKQKHMERSHRSSHNPKPFATFERKAIVVKDQKANRKGFATFERKAIVVKDQKANRKGFLDGLKSLFHRTTNK